MFLHLLLLAFPEWKPHFTLLDGARVNEMMALRWLHLIFGIIWIGLLYFFNLVLTPAMKKYDPALRIKMYPELMSGAMGWFRSSALVTVIVGLRYFTIHLSADARLAGDLSLIGKWFGWWLLVWLVAYIFIYALQLPAKGIRDSLWVRVIGDAAEYLGSGLAHSEASDCLDARRCQSGHAHAGRNGTPYALELSHRADVFLAVFPDALLHGRCQPLSIPQHHCAIIGAGCRHVRREELQRTDD